MNLSDEQAVSKKQTLDFIEKLMERFRNEFKTSNSIEVENKPDANGRRKVELIIVDGNKLQTINVMTTLSFENLCKVIDIRVMQDELKKVVAGKFSELNSTLSNWLSNPFLSPDFLRTLAENYIELQKEREEDLATIREMQKQYLALRAKYIKQLDDEESENDTNG